MCPAIGQQLVQVSSNEDPTARTRSRGGVGVSPDHLEDLSFPAVSQTQTQTLATKKKQSVRLRPGLTPVAQISFGQSGRRNVCFGQSDWRHILFGQSGRRHIFPGSQTGAIFFPAVACRGNIVLRMSLHF
eukprot:gene9589-biopygen4719